MNDIQKEIIEKMREDGLDFKPGWGFGGAWEIGLDDIHDDTPEDEVRFEMFVSGACFDCESVYCVDNSFCDERNSVIVLPSGEIYYEGTDEYYDNVESFINCIY